MDASLLRCQFVIPRKNRTCRMLVKPGKKFCGEHALADPDEQDRILCPLDRNHSVKINELDDHLKRCNSRLRTDFPWVIENINSPSENFETLENGELKTVKNMSTEEIELFAKKVETIFNNIIAENITTDICKHTVFTEVLCSETSIYSSPVQRKHFLQQSSIIGHMENLSLLSDYTNFVEFGAGRAKLSYWLNKCLLAAENCRFITVERSGQRYKFENKAVRESEYECGNAERFCRYRCAVEHFDLRRIPLAVNENCSKPVVAAVCKHLCGSGTDAAIRAVINCRESRDGVEGLNVSGAVFAPCCHHRCTLAEFVGKAQLLDLGFCAAEFSILCQMTSWATCGLTNASNGQASFDREQIGRKCKSILDFCRSVYLKDNGFTVNLKYYVDVDITPENLLLLITPSV